VIFITLQALGWSGYVSPPEGVVQFTQSESALRMIRLLVSPFGATIVSGTIIFAWLFPLSREQYVKIQELLEHRRGRKGKA
jgi:Na+/melibiose symporter-like transporter